MAQTAAEASTRCNAKGDRMHKDVETRTTNASTSFNDAVRRDASNSELHNGNASGDLAHTMPVDDMLMSQNGAVANMLSRLEAISCAEEDDCSKDNQIIKFFELNDIPSRHFKLGTLPSLTAEEQVHLGHLRDIQEKPVADDDPSRVFDPDGADDEAVAWLSNAEQYEVAKRYVETRGDEEAFWTDCYGLCQKEMSRHVGTNREEVVMAVWDVLRLYRSFPRTSQEYAILRGDSASQQIVHRAQILYVPSDHLWSNEVTGWNRGRVSDPRFTVRAALKGALLADLGGSARKLGRCQEGTSPELLVAIAHNSTRECVCVHSFSFLSLLLFFFFSSSSLSKGPNPRVFQKMPNLG